MVAIVNELASRFLLGTSTPMLVFVFLIMSGMAARSSAFSVGANT
jgi:hypothetical protein